MKIGIILPVGRTDKYSYQYKNFNQIIISNLEKFADYLLAVSSSRYIVKEIFENHNKIELLSNKETWFKLINGSEVFSLKVLNDNMNLCKKKIKRID